MEKKWFSVLIAFGLTIAYHTISLITIAYNFNIDRYPNHEASQRIEQTEEYKQEIQKLRGDDGDYFHGFNSGVLAATRLFNEKADILHVNDFEVSCASFKYECEPDHLIIHSYSY